MNRQETGSKSAVTKKDVAAEEKTILQNDDVSALTSVPPCFGIAVVIAVFAVSASVVD